MKSKFLPQLIVLAVILGVLSVGLAQQVVTTTTTTVITLPPVTTTKIIKKPGTTGIATVVHGGYKVVYIEKRPNQECVMVIEGEPRTVITVPGASFPGVTTAFTIPAATYETTITRVEGGTTRTTTGFDYVTVSTTMVVGPISTVMALPIPIYGEIREYCQAITITVINRFEASEPTVIFIAFPGFTFKGTVITMPTLFVTQPVTVTKTTTKPGTTYTTTIERAGTTAVKTISAPGTTITKTITLPAKTITKTITYETTIGKPTATETTKPSPPKPPKPPKETTTISETTAAALELGPLIPLLLIGGIIVVVVVVVVVVLVRRPKPV